jgi:hypothetical protein
MEHSFQIWSAEAVQHKEVPMTCQRCEGLMVREGYDDLELGSGGYEISSWRCLNCGAIVDPVIMAHHHN